MFSNAPLLIPIPTWGFNLGAIRAGRQRFQPEINPEVLGSRRGFRFWHLNDKINVPAFAGVLTETAAFNRTGQFPAFPEAEGVTGIAHRIIKHFDARGFEGNPAERALPAPAQFAFFALLATGGVLLTDRLHALGMESQCFAASSG